MYMITDKQKKGNLTIYHLKKVLTDEQSKSIDNKFIKPSQIKLLIDHDADVYNEEGTLLIRFRKNVIANALTEPFYENIIDFAKGKTSNRGSGSGSSVYDIGKNPQVMTNIIGYFDRLSPQQKFVAKKKGITLKTSVRETRFNNMYPEKFKKLMPMIKKVDDLYAKHIPENYKLQKQKANQTPFHITGTAFTTITTNVNFQTAVHTDKGDDVNGFGVLSVIENGTYEGGETCLPQYGVGVDIRTGDICFMNVHEWHGNLGIKPKTKDAIRLSLVFYLRNGIWLKTKGKSKSFMIQHNKTMKNLREK